MSLNVTHTYALLKVKPGTYNEIATLLRDAGYDQAFDEKGVIDLHGLALAQADEVVAEEPVAKVIDETSADWVLCRTATKSSFTLREETYSTAQAWALAMSKEYPGEPLRLYRFACGVCFGEPKRPKLLHEDGREELRDYALAGPNGSLDVYTNMTESDALAFARSAAEQHKGKKCTLYAEVKTFQVAELSIADAEAMARPEPSDG